MVPFPGQEFLDRMNRIDRIKPKILQEEENPVYPV
jgi:hypothetical protein